MSIEGATFLALALGLVLVLTPRRRTTNAVTLYQPGDLLRLRRRS
jgi:hypothetical protein